MNRFGILAGLTAVGAMLGAASVGPVVGDAGRAVKAPVIPPKPLDGEDAFKKAKADGKYEMLLAQIKVEDDWNTHAEFKDLGLRGRREYKGHKNLPRGYWVYVYPHWYIWRDETATPMAARSWGPEQATGEPNAAIGTDSSSAWASLTADGQDEWLLLEYAEPILPKTIEVHETYCPGALVKVTGFKLDGSEVELWKGDDPTAAGSGSGVSKITVKADFKITRVKLYFDSINVTSWNEIDAVGVRDDKKKTHWAVAAHASSTYAQSSAPADDPKLQRLEEKIESLEEELEELRAAVKKLKEQLDKKGQ